jgi:hypothetical protein
MAVFQPMCMLCGNSGRIIENEILAGRPSRNVPCPQCRPQEYRRQQEPPRPAPQESGE